MFIESGILLIAEELPVCICAIVTVDNCCDNDGRQVRVAIRVIMIREEYGFTILIAPKSRVPNLSDAA